MATSRVPRKRVKAGRKEPPMSKASQFPDEVLQQQIRERAYQLYVERGGEHGHDLEDWLRAEVEISPSKNSLAAEFTFRVA